jgi:hypothetical protein
MRGWLKNLLAPAADPQELATRVNRAAALINSGAHAEGAEECRRALAIDPRSVHALCNLSVALLRLDELDAAEENIRRALREDPSFQPAHSQLGDVLLARGRPDDAVASYREAVKRLPDSALARNSLGYALQVTGALDDALRCYDEALVLDPRYVQAHVNRAGLWLLGEDFARGWDEYEWRLRDPRNAIPLERFAPSRWDGSPLAGRSILVHAEQGLGDQIMYASCLAETMKESSHCAVCCEERLVPLFQRSFPRARFTALPPDGERFDLAIELASLPRWLRRSAQSFPRHEGYLRADPQRVAAWREKLARLGPGRKIGLSWRGGVRETGQPWRSLDPRQLQPLVDVPGVRFVSLQYTPEAAREAAALGIAHWPEAIADYEDTAALACALDLTVSVCTAVVHLCGALGRPAWVMAPVSPEPRYGFSGERMRWYPSVRMFRQGAFGDWQPVIRDIVSALALPPRHR